MGEIKPIKANSDEGGDVYRLLNMVHSMAGSLAVANKDHWELAETNSSEFYGPITTVWTNGVINIEARSWRHGREIPYHEYSLYAAEIGGRDE